MWKKIMDKSLVPIMSVFRVELTLFQYILVGLSLIFIIVEYYYGRISGLQDLGPIIFSSMMVTFFIVIIIGGVRSFYNKKYGEAFAEGRTEGYVEGIREGAKFGSVLTLAELIKIFVKSPIQDNDSLLDILIKLIPPEYNPNQ